MSSINITFKTPYSSPTIDSQDTKKSSDPSTSTNSQPTTAEHVPAVNSPYLEVSVPGNKRMKLFGQKLSILVPFTHKVRTHKIDLSNSALQGEQPLSTTATVEAIDVTLGINPLDASKKPLSVGVIGCGGTIAGAAKSTTDAASYKAGEAKVDDVLENCNIPSEIRKNIRSTVDAMKIDSINMTDSQRLELLNTHIQAMIDNPNIASIVITHGSDSMEETAYFLNLAAKTDKPIVLLGSMRPGTHDAPDGRPNMRDALLVAQSPLAKGRGVLVVMNNKIFSARGLFKDATTDVAAFDRSHQIGSIDGTQVRFRCESTRTHTSDTEFDVSNLDDLPNVQRIPTDTDPKIIDAYIAQGCKGFVVEGAGNGNIPSGGLREKLAEVAQDGVLVVRSKVGTQGSVTHNGAINDDEYGFVSSDNLSSKQACVLAKLVLTTTKSRQEIQEMYNKY